MRGLRPANRKRYGSAKCSVRAEHDPVCHEPESWEPPRERLQSNASLSTRERRTEAVVDPLAEGEMLPCVRPIDVKRVRVDEHALVVSGGREPQLNHRAGRDAGVAECHIVRRHSHHPNDPTFNQILNDHAANTYLWMRDFIAFSSKSLQGFDPKP
jgi:hypothetical protein